MSKRNLFRELAQGIDEMCRFDQDKATLRTHRAAVRPTPYVDAATIVETRERLNVSRAVFARRLQVSPRTLENWKQGRAKPNAQAAALS